MAYEFELPLAALMSSSACERVGSCQRAVSGGSARTSSSGGSGQGEATHQALGDGLDVAESSLAGAGGEQEDSLVHAAERGDIHSLQRESRGASVHENTIHMLFCLILRANKSASSNAAHLAADNTSGADAGGILTRAGVDDGINEDLWTAKAAISLRYGTLAVRH